ncbi:MAG TPA: OsmC family protein [Prolixibacteraceae bacterium]|jgi:uncharacterized OsmC-like protein
MKISAMIKSNFNHHDIVVQTDEMAKEMRISPQSTGFGSSVSGAELLLLSLATCYCDDLYREASKRNMTISGMEVVFNGEFGAEGEAGTHFTYQAHIRSDEPAAEIEELIQYTDRIAEVHNTLRKGVNITLTP